MDINKVVLIGRLTKDPELRFTPDGTPVTTLRLAVNRRPNREGKTETDFFDVIVWRRAAELCSQYIKKGYRIALEGRLRTRSWQTSDGQNRSKVEVEATNVQFLDRPRQANQMVEEELVEGGEILDENAEDTDDIPF